MITTFLFILVCTVTGILAEGIGGRVNVIYTILERYDVDHVINIVERFNPHRVSYQFSP